MRAARPLVRAHECAWSQNTQSQNTRSDDKGFKYPDGPGLDRRKRILPVEYIRIYGFYRWILPVEYRVKPLSTYGGVLCRWFDETKVVQ